MVNYKEEIKNLFLRYYSPMGDDYQKDFLSTNDILQMMRGIIPIHPIDEHDIYDVMKEIGFTQGQKILYEKICTFEGDEEKGIPPEYEEAEIGRVFCWVVYKNN